MKNLVQKGDVIELTAPYETLSGAGCLVNNIFGIAQDDVANGAKGVYWTQGVFTLPKVSTDVIAIGAVVYWKAGDKEVTTTKTSNYRIGVALSVAGNPSATVQVRLDGVSTVQEAGGG